MADGTVSLELGQRAVVAVCTRKDFLMAKAAIELLAEEMLKDLDQEAVCVLAFPGGESFLLNQSLALKAGSSRGKEVKRK